MKTFLCLLLFSVTASAAEPRLETVIRDRSLNYFLENAHPVTGLVRDRAKNDDRPMGYDYGVASIAATGFGLAVLAHAAEVGLVPRSKAEKQIARTLAFILNHLEDHHGWLYHFVDWETGARAFSSEVSTMDSALLFAGALYAGAIFPDTETARLANELFVRADFSDMRTDGGALQNKLTLNMGWLPEVGYLPWNWDSYAEHMVLLILGLGHPTRPLPAASWKAWSRGDYGRSLPLFVHQYSHLFIDFRNFHDGYENYFQASVDATKLNRDYCLSKTSSKTYETGLWGLSASGSTDGYYPFSPATENGTVCLGCALASLPFLTDEIRHDLAAWEKLPEFPFLFGKYGFSDSTNLDRVWHDPDAIGITVGAAYFALSALGPEPIWSKFSAVPAVKRGLEAAYSNGM